MTFEVNDIYGKKNKLLISKTRINIEENSLLLIKGKNGSGKTLLLNKLFDICIKNHCNATYIEQSNKFILEKESIAQNIAMSKNPERIKKVEDLLKDNDMEHLLNHSSTELSGGEKRLICLMRGLFSDANYIFIDEPTNDLDYLAVEKLKKLLVEYKQTKTIIVISHDDRIDKIADKVLLIDEKKINIAKKSKFESIEAIESENEYKNTEILEIKNKSENLEMLENQNAVENKEISDFLKICNKKNYLAIVVIIITAILSIYAIYTYMAKENYVTTEIVDKEVDIISPMSEMFLTGFTEGALPIKGLACFDKSLNLEEKLKIYNDILEDANHMSITYDLDIEKNEKYDLFELEYYDLMNREHFFTLDYFKKLFKIKEDENIDTSQYFLLEKKAEPIAKARFTRENFEKSLKNLKKLENDKKRKLECVVMVIHLKDGMTFEELINQKSIRNLMLGNYYIRSKETIEMTNNIKSFQNKKDTIIFLIYMTLLLLFLEALVSLACLMTNNKTIRIFRNAGFTPIEIYKITRKQYLQVVFRILSIFIANTICIGILLFNNSPITMAAFIGSVFMIVTNLLAYKIVNLIVKKYIKRVCNWRYR